MTRVFRRAQELGLRVKLHAEQLSNSGGARLAVSFGALSADHLEHLDERQVGVCRVLLAPSRQHPGAEGAGFGGQLLGQRRITAVAQHEAEHAREGLVEEAAECAFLATREAVSGLLAELSPDWLHEQRWFRSKAREIASIERRHAGQMRW